MRRRVCVFAGRVQGVGFRYIVHNLAIQYNVQGYVRNLDDGRVELVIEGPAAEMAQLQDAIQQRMGEYIRDAQTTESPATGEFGSFTIRH